MSNQHTPGPWRIGKCRFVVADSEIGTYADDMNHEYYDGYLVAESIKSPANARLIAAAPDLLAACKAMQAALRATSKTDKDYSHELKLARAAIGKAT